MDDLLAEFLTETAERLDELDVNLVRFEQAPNDAEMLNAIFRTCAALSCRVWRVSFRRMAISSLAPRRPSGACRTTSRPSQRATTVSTIWRMTSRPAGEVKLDRATADLLEALARARGLTLAQLLAEYAAADSSMPGRADIKTGTLLALGVANR
jgi:hypothetical protein